LTDAQFEATGARADVARARAALDHALGTLPPVRKE
jgi:hypothetical protein